MSALQWETVEELDRSGSKVTTLKVNIDKSAVLLSIFTFNHQ